MADSKSDPQPAPSAPTPAPDKPPTGGGLIGQTGNSPGGLTQGTVVIPPGEVAKETDFLG